MRPIDLNTFCECFFEKIFSKTKRVNGCWIFEGRTNRQGYGQVIHKGRHYLVHRLSWAHAKQLDPGKGLVLHRCDVPGCINPDHLFLGTARENTLDMLKKGRWKGPSLEGTKNPAAKLSEAQVKEIKRSSETTTNLARQYCVGRTTIKEIRAGVRWRHVK